MPEWMLATIAGVIISLQAWILLEVIKLKILASRFDNQMGRFESELESEKGTRRRIHRGLNRRIRHLEMHTNTQAPEHQEEGEAEE